MPVYNAETYLAEAVESILAQTLSDIELVAVDDASQDDSRAMLERFAQDDERVRMFTNDENLGVAASRNLGWRSARALYIAVLDADDIALPDRLARQVSFLDANPAVAAVGGAVIGIDSSGRRLGMIRFPVHDRAIQSTLPRRNCFGHSAMTMRRSALEAVGGYAFRGRAEDYALWLRLAERFALANLPEPVTLHRFHPGQTTVLATEKEVAAALALSAAARTRRATGIDPLAEVDELTPEVLRRLGVSDRQLATAVADEMIAQAATLAQVGAPETSSHLVEQATAIVGRRARKRFVASVEVKHAGESLRARCPAAAGAHLGRAFVSAPWIASVILARWLAPRVRSGHVPRFD
jgi:hypothetical protein